MSANDSPTREAADREAIDAVRDAWVAAVAAGNASALADLVTPDYEVWAHATPAFTGPDTVVAMMGAAMSRYAITQQYDPIETIISGDWAFQRGIEQIHGVPRDSGPIQDTQQRALLILHRGVDGRWRYARGMTNGLPATATTSHSDVKSQQG